MDKKDLKIVFLGTPDFAVCSLEHMVGQGFNVVGVVTMPDKPAGRGHKMLQSPVKQFAVARGLHLMQPSNLKDPAFISELSGLGADLFVVIAFRMLPRQVWQMPRLGTFNLHASLLPRYRGAAPINWAVINGDTRTGVTTFFLKHEIDTGDIISQQAIDILPSDNVGDVHDKLMHLGADLTIDTLQCILRGDLNPIPQEQLLQGEEPTPAPKIFKDTCRIDWNKTAVQVHNLVRGLSPYPAAWTEFDNGMTAKVFETQVLPATQTVPGLITAKDGRLVVGCLDGAIEILSIQPEGKKRMAAADFLRGLRQTPEKAL